MSAVTSHKIYFQNAECIHQITDESIHLVVTSPPYPMIEMWDTLFSSLNSDIRAAFSEQNPLTAFNLMHAELNKVWREIARITIPGGLVCINIGDAVRTIGDNFALYPNHVKIIQAFQDLGFQSLPEILWRKQTNAPNKFMGSGMLPPGAYVTLEHEYILIFRKGGKREFVDPKEKERRKESAYFWEERNTWFSDVWDFKGIFQSINSNMNREKSAAFPFELAYRLINMFSIKGDTILDPFLGTGTTLLAAISSERNSIGIELDASFKDLIHSNIVSFIPIANQYIQSRIEAHEAFIKKRQDEGKELKYSASKINSRVITAQETEIKLRKVKDIQKISESEFRVEYIE